MKQRLNIIFDDTIRISKADFEALTNTNKTLKDIIIRQQEELEKYKNFFENFKKLVDKQ